jgi:hypothetical protein
MSSYDGSQFDTGLTALAFDQAWTPHNTRSDVHPKLCTPATQNSALGLNHKLYTWSRCSLFV